MLALSSLNILFKTDKYFNKYGELIKDVYSNLPPNLSDFSGYNQYLKTYNKHYNSSEYMTHYKIYMNNINRIHNHNKKIIHGKWESTILLIFLLVNSNLNLSQDLESFASKKLYIPHKATTVSVDWRASGL